MQKIVPHFWFDTQAVEAAEFYATVFPDSKVRSVQKVDSTPSGDVNVVTFSVMGYECQAMSAGPMFKVNPSISLMLNFDPSQMPDARRKIDEVWEKLIDGGKALMEIGEYPFSERYGWVEDKYGVSWQLILTKPEGEERPVVLPSLLFTNEVSGKAEEASDFWISVFKDAKRGAVAKFEQDTPVQKKGDTMFTDFMLEGQWFAAMDGGSVHEFGFNEGVSLIVQCEDQAEIDRLWETLSAVPEAEACGWLKDKYGVSWQIVPATMGALLAANPAKTTPVMLAMKKIDIAALEKAAE